MKSVVLRYGLIVVTIFGLVSQVYGQSTCSVLEFMSQDQDLTIYDEFISILQRVVVLNDTVKSYLENGYDGLLLVPTNEVAAKYYTLLNDVDLVKVILMHIILDEANVNTIGPHEVTLSGTTLLLKENEYVENEEGDISTIVSTFKKILPCGQQFELWIMDMMVLPPGMKLPQAAPTPFLASNYQPTLLTQSAGQGVISQQQSVSSLIPPTQYTLSDQYSSESLLNNGSSMFSSPSTTTNNQGDQTVVNNNGFGFLSSLLAVDYSDGQLGRSFGIAQQPILVGNDTYEVGCKIFEQFFGSGSDWQEYYEVAQFVGSWPPSQSTSATLLLPSIQLYNRIKQNLEIPLDWNMQLYLEFSSQDVVNELSRLFRLNQLIGSQVKIPSLDEISSQAGQYKLPQSQWIVEQFSPDVIELVDENNNERIQISEKNQKICNYSWIIHVVEDYFGL